VAATQFAVEARPGADAIQIELANHGASDAVFVMTMDPRYPVTAARRQSITVGPGQSTTAAWALAASDNWYDIGVHIEGVAGFARRFAGKVENGRAGRTDPGIGAMQLWA